MRVSPNRSNVPPSRDSRCLKSDPPCPRSVCTGRDTPRWNRFDARGSFRATCPPLTLRSASYWATTGSEVAPANKGGRRTECAGFPRAERRRIRETTTRCTHARTGGWCECPRECASVTVRTPRRVGSFVPRVRRKVHDGRKSESIVDVHAQRVAQRCQPSSLSVPHRP